MNTALIFTYETAISTNFDLQGNDHGIFYPIPKNIF